MVVQKSVIKRKLKFEEVKKYLKATELENRIKQLEQNKANINSLKKYHKNYKKQ